MKIIVKESQYNLIKEFIEEAKKYPKKSQEKMGEFLDEILEKTDVGSVLVFSTGSATFSLECTSINNKRYTFKVIDDKHNVFNKQDVVKLNLVDGNDSLDVYQNNVKKVTYNSMTDTYGLLFSNMKKEIFNIKEIKFLNKPQQQEPQQQEPQQQEPQQQQQQQQQQEPKQPSNDKTKENNLKKDAKAAYLEILNDPKLRDAFYKQPTFWQTFTAELNGKKPQGSGILRALNIVNKYNLKNFQNDIKNKLNVNQKITIKFIDPTSIKNKKGEEVSFAKDEKIIVYPKINKETEEIVLKGNKNGVDFSILFNVVSGDETNVFKSKISKNNIINFQIIPDESPGYKLKKQN